MIENSSRPPQISDRLIFVVFALLTILWIVLRLPSVPQAIMDADAGHQLAGATQILKGQQPFVDFEATYGPLTFYASALAQMLSGGRLMGEFILCMLGYAIAYGLLAVLMRRITNHIGLTCFFGVLALLLMPRLYKYYIVLGPVVTLWLTWLYIQKPKFTNLLWLALTVVITGLFRADLGVYCTVAATVAVFLRPYDRLKSVIGLWGSMVLFALPWLGFLVWRGGLQRYFYDMLTGGLNIATGMSLAFPMFRVNQPIFSEGNLFFITAILLACFPAVLWGFLALRWRFLEQMPRAMLICAATLYTLCLVQAISRFDVPHISQTLPLTFLLVAWVTGVLLTQAAAARTLALLLCLTFALPVTLIGRSGWPSVSVADLPEKMAQFSLPKDQMLVNANTPTRYGYVTMMLYLRRCVGEGQALMALPALTTFPYFTDRSFGGGQIGVVSGYFVTEADQRRIVATMKKQDIPLIVYVPNYSFDNLPERRLEVVAPLVARYIRANYRLLKSVGNSNVLLRRDLVVEKRVIGLENYSCPVPRR